VKYTHELTQKIVLDYQSGVSAAQIAANLTLALGEPVPEKSVIAKLSHLRVYEKKGYLTKRGEPPVKKEEYIVRIAKLLDVNAEILESLEKVNKSVLHLIESRLQRPEQALPTAPHANLFQ